MNGSSWSATTPLVTGYLTLMLLLGGFGSWSIFTKIDGAIIALGQIEVYQDKQIVQHPDGGVVEEIAVKESQTVQVGDILLRLDGHILKSELSVVEGKLFEMLARRDRLAAESKQLLELIISEELTNLRTTHPSISELIQDQRKLFIERKRIRDNQRRQLSKRSDQIAFQIQGLIAQTQAVTTQISLIKSDLAKQKTLLELHLVRSDRVMALERDHANLEGNLGQLLSAQAEANGRAAEIDLEMVRIDAARNEEISTQLGELNHQIFELKERRYSLTERIVGLDVRAPVSGIVLDLQITTPRSVLRSADLILYIVPQDRPLFAAAKIPPIHRDEVHVGQLVRLVFPAFSARAMPEVFGRVATISAGSLTEKQTQSSYYRAEIEINNSELMKFAPLKLTPGMPVEAFIDTGAHSPISYLLKPFTDYFAMAMREQ